MTDPATDDLPTSRAVVEAVAQAEGADPTELTPPLYTAIDPDVLDSIFEQGSENDGGGQLVFDYLGYEVTVRDSGDVHVVEHNGQDPR